MSLIIKPGGSFTHKSGASFGVKDSGPVAPAYIISGLEQSHWLASNAVVSGGRVTSIPDESGVQSLTPLYDGGGYVSNGWQLNGKTLPTVRRDSGGSSIYKANTWATKLSGYSGAFTIATLFRPQIPWQADFYVWYARNSGVGNEWLYGPGFKPGIDANSWLFSKRVNSPLADASASSSGGIQTTPQLFITEYRGTSYSGSNAWRFWINGTQRTLNPGYNDTPGLSSLNEFFVMGNQDRGWPQDTDMAQFHIWKGALTTEQRDSVTAYLKSISGIA